MNVQEHLVYHAHGMKRLKKLLAIIEDREYFLSIKGFLLVVYLV